MTRCGRVVVEAGAGPPATGGTLQPREACPGERYSRAMHVKAWSARMRAWQFPKMAHRGVKGHTPTLRSTDTVQRTSHHLLLFYTRREEREGNGHTCNNDKHMTGRPTPSGRACTEQKGMRASQPPAMYTASTVARRCHPPQTRKGHGSKQQAPPCQVAHTKLGHPSGALHGASVVNVHAVE